MGEKEEEHGNLAKDIVNEVRKLREVKAEYRRVFLDPEGGKSVLLDILQLCGVTREVYVKGDVEQSAYNEGARSVALAILDQLDMRGFEGILELEKRGVELVKLGEDS